MQTLVPGADPIELVSYYEEFAWYYPNCEPETKFWFVKNVKPDWTIFDVGANVGYYSVLFSRLAPQGQVHAFEPTSTVEMLRANVAHNNAYNVQVHQMALGSKTGQVEDGIYRIWGEQPERGAYPFSRIDDLVQQMGLTKLDCIKIDVDSFDFEVLLGAKQTIQALKPAIVVELNHALSRRAQSNMQALEWLRDLGIQEVLCVDGDNFVILPGGRPSTTYPVKHSMTVLFGDNSGVPSPGDEGAITTLKAIDPQHGAQVSSGSLTVIQPQDNAGQGGVEITTMAQQWAFATGYPVADLELTADPRLRVAVDLEVRSGRVGVGLLTTAGDYQGPERFIGAGARRTILLPISDPATITTLMIRNGEEAGAASVARVFGVKVGLLQDDGSGSSRELPVRLLSERVREAEAETVDPDWTPPQSDGVIDVVDYDGLAAALGFDEPFATDAGSGEVPLMLWKMERDDAPIFRYVYRNLKPRRHLEYGTWQGFGVVQCASSCDAEIWTLNLPDGELTDQGKPLYGVPGQDGVVQTDGGESIGRLYREAGYAGRVHQILADSTKWDTSGFEPGFFDSALIDGGHTYDVVVSDTEKTIPLVRPGGIVMWHDFCPDEEALQAHVAPRGVVEALARNHHRWREHFSRIFWVRPSWVLVGVRR